MGDHGLLGILKKPGDSGFGSQEEREIKEREEERKKKKRSRRK